MCALGWGFGLNCVCCNVVPAARAMGTLPASRSSDESKVPLLLPSTFPESKSVSVCMGPWECCLRMSQATSAKVLDSLAHLWVTSHEASGYFCRNMACEHSPGKQYFGVTLRSHLYATKTCFGSCKL